MRQRSTGGNEGILDLNGNRLRIISGLTIQHDANGNRRKALALGGNHSTFSNGHDVLVTGLEHHLGVIGEERIQVIVQGNRLGRIHGQCVAVTEEPGIAGIAQQFFITVDHVIGLQRIIAGKVEYISNRFIVATVAFITFFKNSDRESQTLIGRRITDLDHSRAGTSGNDLVIDNANNTGSGGSELQQLAPLGGGIDQRLQRVHLIGAQSQALFQAIKIEVNIIVGQADLICSQVQSVVINRQNIGVYTLALCIDRIFL